MNQSVLKKSAVAEGSATTRFFASQILRFAQNDKFSDLNLSF